jgi:hypothetical protein
VREQIDIADADGRRAIGDAPTWFRARPRHTDAVVIGAGPYGLATAAHLAASGLTVRTFGEPMESWSERMPIGMYLKSTPSASNISAPHAGGTLADFAVATGEESFVGHRPVPIDSFVRYGLWFMDRNVREVERRRVERVARYGSGFSVVLDDGEEFAASSVVVASGLSGVAHVPVELTGVASVSHSSEHRDLSRFAGKRVAVIGAGQSALENAAILNEHGAKVEVFVRGPRVLFAGPPADVTHQGRGTVLKPESPLGPGWSLFTFSHLPAGFRRLPASVRMHLIATVLGPFGAWWLRDRVEDCVPVHLAHRLDAAATDGEKVRLVFACSSGERRAGLFDHVMAATGYRIDMDRLEFLDASLRHGIARTAGTWPALGPSFNSSVPGLYFTGLAAAATFGPLMRFVAGTAFAGRRVTAAVSRR